MRNFKLLSVALLCLLAFSTNAQVASFGWPSYYSGSNPYSTKLDTVDNTGADTFRCAVTGLCNVHFQFDVTKINGTLGGTIKVFGSKDGGLNYGAALNTYTVTDGSQISQYDINSGNGNPYTHYMVVWAGTGTMSGSWKGYLLIRK